MPKFATKAADNMFCQARYEAAKFNERLSSREGAAEELGVDRTRLARIELGSVTPYPEEVLLMADIYRAPELKGNYCREMCPLGKGMPKIENQDIDRIALRALCSFRKINEAKGGKIMNVRKVQDMRKNVEHQYITEDSKTRIYLSVVREFNEKEYEEYSKKKKRAKIKKRIRFLKRSMVYIVPTAVSLIFFGYLSDMLCAIRGSAELGSEWIAIPLMWVWVYALTRFAVGDAY